MSMRNEKPQMDLLEPLVISRIFPASRELVFKAWSSAEHLKRWFCPEGYSVPEAKVDFRVGGDLRLCMRSAQGQEHWTRGKYAEIVTNSRLVIDMEAVGPEERALFRAHTVVKFEEQRGGSTRVEVTQSYTLFDADAQAMIKGASLGWKQTLDRLEREVTRIGQSVPARSVVHATFSIERTLPVPCAAVFKAFTEPQAKAKWFGNGCTLLAREIDVRPGGREHVKGRWESGVVSTFDAYYHDVVANERIVYSYVMHLDERKISVSLATFEFEAAGGSTRLVMTEQGTFLDGYDDAGARESGSNFLLDALGKSLTE